MSPRQVAPQTFQKTLGPFVGVHDSADPGASKTTKLYAMVNMVIEDVKNGSPALARHGFIGLFMRLAGKGQCVYSNRRTDGTVDRLLFGGGRMYRWDGDVTTVDITPTGVAIDATNPVFCTTFLEEVVIHDENNTPWIWTPATGAGELIDIDGLGTPWCAKGPATVRSGKVVFILGRLGESALLTEDDYIILFEDDYVWTTELQSGFQNTIIWSFDGNVRIGYMQPDTPTDAGFDNTLTLIQASSEVLGFIAGHENGIAYYRNKGIGTVLGEIDDDFQTANTKDQIDGSTGTDAPAAAQLIGTSIWSVDMDGRVECLSLGGAIESVWFQMRREVGENTDTAANRADVVRFGRIGYHEGYKVVLFTIWDPQVVYVFDERNRRFLGTFPINGTDGDGIHVHAMGPMVDANNRSTFVVLGTRTNVDDDTTNGVIWRQAHADDPMQWLDQPDESVAAYDALERFVESHQITSNAAAEYQATEIAAQLAGDSARHQVNFQYVTPSAGLSTAMVARSTAVVGPANTARAACSPGPNAQGNALRLRVGATHSDNVRFGVHNITLDAIVTKARPGSR